MGQTPHEEETRRGFLSIIGRYSLLAVILGGAIAILARPRKGGGTPGAAACSHCPVLSRCGEPRAETARESAGGGAPSGGEPLCDDFAPGEDGDLR